MKGLITKNIISFPVKNNNKIQLSLFSHQCSKKERRKEVGNKGIKMNGKGREEGKENTGGAITVIT